MARCDGLPYVSYLLRDVGLDSILSPSYPPNITARSARLIRVW